MFKVNKQSGFTLLELMLVLVILATITAMGIGAYQQQMMNFKVDKTALQMQQWMEAAVAYNVNNKGNWPMPTASCPTINAVLENDPIANPCKLLAPVMQYIKPGSIDTNPFGSGYVLPVPSSATNPTFQVQVTVPAAMKNATTIAQRIAAHLPNSSVGSNGLLPPTSTTVTASVVVPSQGGGSNTSIVFIDDTLHDGNVVPYPGASGVDYRCTANTEKQIAVAFIEFQSPSFTDGLGKHYLPATDSTVSYTTDDANQQWVVHLLSKGVSGVNSYTTNVGTILAIVSCKPKQTSVSGNDANSALNFKF